MHFWDKGALEETIPQSITNHADIMAITNISCLVSQSDTKWESGQLTPHKCVSDPFRNCSFACELIENIRLAQEDPVFQEVMLFL